METIRAKCPSIVEASPSHNEPIPSEPPAGFLFSIQEKCFNYTSITSSKIIIFSHIFAMYNFNLIQFNCVISQKSIIDFCMFVFVKTHNLPIFLTFYLSLFTLFKYGPIDRNLKYLI